VSLRYLLDTNIVSWPYRDPSHPIVERLNGALEECAISAQVWHELRYGVFRRPRGRKRDSLEAYMRDVVRASYPTLPYDQPAAEWHAAERARLVARGVNTQFVDGQIAAVAHVNGLIVVSHDARGFAHFNDIAVEDWING